MPFNIAVFLVLFGGWFFGRLFAFIGMPHVLGMVVWGICTGSLWSESLPPLLFQLEPFLKSVALIVILLRAGLGINKTSLKETGMTALFMAFVPCIVEGFVLTAVFHYLFEFNWAVAGLTGFMIAAVSPAVVIPSMLHLKDQGYSPNNRVPTIILAGASVDDVFAITLFSIFLQMAITGELAVSQFLTSIPLSLLLGIVPGILIGFFLVWYFRLRYSAIRATEKALVLLMVSVMVVEVGNWLHSAALLGIMTIGFILLEKDERVAHELSQKLSKIWIFAEIILFVLIGISVDLSVAWNAGFMGLLAISIGLIFRSMGVFIATLFSGLSIRERLFCMIAYLPKATVQAALGGVALAQGLAEGDVILALAVLAIIFTAPVGLIGIKYTGKTLLSENIPDQDRRQ